MGFGLFDAIDMFIVFYDALGGKNMPYLFYIICFIILPAVIILFKGNWWYFVFRDAEFRLLNAVCFDTYLWHSTVIHLMLYIGKLNNIPTTTIVYMLITAACCFAIGTISHLVTSAIRKNR